MNDSILFQDLSNKYILLDYFPTHSQLLIRRPKNKTIDYNTDIVFKPVKMMYLTDSFNGISISQLSEPEAVLDVKRKFKMITEYGYKIFRIVDSGNNEYYINAMVFGVFENKLELLKSILNNDLSAEQNKTLFWSE